MAEVEYKGIKVGGSKLLLIIPLIGTIVGGLWGGFEVYQRYLEMEAKISKFVTTSLSEDSRLHGIVNASHNSISSSIIPRTSWIKFLFR